MELLEAEWPIISPAQGVKIEGKICLKWRVRLEAYKTCWALLYLYYGNDGIMECDSFYHPLLFAEINNESRDTTMPLEQLYHVRH